MTSISFGRCRIGENEPVVVVAEIGINHEGDAERCLALVRAAARAGADAIKLQTSDPDENYPPQHPSHALFSRARLSREATAAAFGLARELGMEAFTTTGFSDLPWVSELNPPAYKVSSGLMAHVPLIRALASLGRPLILSTGMSALSEIDNAVEAARGAGCEELVVLQCTSLYPAPPESISLRTIGWLAARYGVPTGFSDHALGPEVSAMAVATGACLIEKHFTLDAHRPEFDHAISLDESGFARMVELIRLAEAVRGRPEKVLTSEQAANAARMRRVLVARRSIPRGAVVTADDVAVMRSPDGRDGLMPRDLEGVLGRRVRRAIGQWTTLAKDDLSEA